MPRPLSGDSPRPETRAVIQKMLERAVRPMTADEIHRDIPGLYRLDGPALSALLQQEAGAGPIHRWPAGPGSRKERYWHRNAAAYFKDRVTAALSGRTLTKTDLLETVKKGAVPFAKTRLSGIVHTILTALVKEKTVFEIPAAGRYRSLRFALHPPDPGGYLGRTRKEFDAVCRKLKKSGVRPEQVLAALADLLNLPQAPLSSPRPEDPAANTAPPEEADVSETVLRRVVTAMFRIVPSAGRQAPVWIPDLRNALKDLPKPVFDRAVGTLASRGVLFLNRHAHPAQMTDAEKETMIPDGQGNFYVVAVLREGTAG